jgi:tetratricopeptide (TPR) repeat protein
VADRLLQLLALIEADPRDTFCLYGVAQEYARRGDPSTAVSWYDRCLAVDPNYCYAYYHKAKALEESGRSADAIAALRIGFERAKATGDLQARNEIATYLDELDG